MKVGFVVNPIAGMGGRVGLKGTDGVVDEALAKGATPVAPGKAREMLSRFWEDLRFHVPEEPVEWLTCSGEMGEDYLREVELENYETVYDSPERTGSGDTKKACQAFMDAGVDIIVFCGGDGTARDVNSIANGKVPILGIPSGVKMHSGVFGTHATSVAEVLLEYLNGELRVGDAEILDLDEDLYRQGEWSVRLYGTAKTVEEPTFIQAGKLMVEEVSEDDVRDDLAEHMEELVSASSGTLFILGPGGTMLHIGERLGLDATLLGVDAVAGGKLVGKDCDEKTLLELLDKHAAAKIVVSPIGAQGFILGRGNLQISPAVVKMVGIKNIIVLATPIKLRDTPFLRVDSGNRELDETFQKKGHMLVTFGYHIQKLVKIGK